MPAFIDYLKITIPYTQIESERATIRALARSVSRKFDFLVLNIKRELFNEIFFSDYGNVARVDIALDLPFRPDIGDYDVHITNKQGGETFYVNNRRSQRFCRIYDKGAQLGTEALIWRIEYELKGRLARNVRAVGVNLALRGEQMDKILDVLFSYADNLGYSRYLESSIDSACFEDKTSNPRYNWKRVAKRLITDTEAQAIVLHEIEKHIAELKRLSRLVDESKTC